MTKIKDGYISQFEDEKRNLYLFDGKESEVIEEHLSIEDALQAIGKYLKHFNIKSYYMRMWESSTRDRVIIDFGSYFKFFHWANAPISLAKEPKLSIEQMAKNISDSLKESNSFLVERPTGWVRVEIWLDEATGKYCFVNMTKKHICKCRFDTIEDAIIDLEKHKAEGKVLRYIQEEKV